MSVSSVSHRRRRSRLLATTLALTALLAPSLMTGRSPRVLANPSPQFPTTRFQDRVAIAEGELDYEVTAGFVALNPDDDDEAASIYYTAYRREQPADAPPRPITIAFNGGPGASSLYLHLLGLAPHRLALAEDGMPLPDAPQLVENPDTWLTFTDLVFVDPPGTGFSPVGRPNQAKRHFDLRGDAQLIGEFVRQYLQQTEQVDAPVYLAGESYGGTRAVLLAAEQAQSGDLNLKGLILISPVLDYQFLDPRASGNLKLTLTLPTLAATARYHDRLPVPPAGGWEPWLANVESWAIRSYLPALVQGDRLAPAPRRAIARQLSRYTGLPARWFDERDLRLTSERFRQRLLAGRQLDRWDSRLTYTTISPSERLEQAMLTAWSDYAAENLGIDGEYVIFSRPVNQQWQWDNLPFNLDLAPKLGDTLRRQSELRVFAAAGYYDLVVPFAAVHYSLNRLGLPDGESDRVQLRYYAAGHMVYLPASERQRLQTEVATFVQAESSALGDRPPAEQPILRGR
ncbi:MAG: hypothetical protein HC910_00150 [Spirulinaceae cyanobacterium SM2_1_0]|nr:hypothetical protein [Spirulinaceae cyanobacterium SM2_1_0]